MSRSLRVAGVDGCARGWAVALAELQPGRIDRGRLRPSDVIRLELTVAPMFDPILELRRRGEIDAIAVDMPIGLLDDHPRAADVEARRRLGPRRSSVFPTPVRAVLMATTYAEANAGSRAAAGVGLSRQAFNLLPKIRELDRLLTQSDQDRVVEAHPELAFAELCGGPLGHSKKSVDGAAQRRGVLRRTFGRRLDAVLDERPVPLDDALDALALITVADRVAREVETRLGRRIDATGKRAELVC